MPEPQPCPECDAAVAVADDVRVHEVIECPECAAELEVAATDPVLLTLAPDVEEDWGE
ncbi:lysine biosynthesis protein LysW [Jatrophihabitans endophyticus]|nr:lysine biosynthesis protein LysW [Jatrophihabitans endophyticus]